MIKDLCFLKKGMGKCVKLLYLEETYLGLELVSQSYQWILQEESHTIDLLSIQIDKYKTIAMKPITQPSQKWRTKICREKLGITQYSVEISALNAVLDWWRLNHIFYSDTFHRSIASAYCIFKNFCDDFDVTVC